MDLKEMMAHDTLPNNAFIVACEFDEKKAKAVKKFLETHFKNRYYLHIGDVCNFNPEEVLNGNKFDLAYFDFCGNFKMELRAWLYKNNKHFADDCRVCYTFKTINRKKQAEASSKYAYRKSVKDVIESKMQFANSNFSKGIWGKSLDKNRLGVIASVNMYLADLFVAFDTKDFDINQVIMYKDGKHSEMVFIDTVLNGRKKSTKALFNGSIANYFNRVCKSKANSVRKVLGIKTINNKKRGRKKGQKNGAEKVEKKPTIATICGVKNRADSLTGGRRMVVSKYIKKYAKDNGVSVEVASKRVWGGINRELTGKEKKVA
jgi:hypothetical protein